MKIAILAKTTYPIRKPFYGGMEMHTYALAEELIARGHEVVLFAAEGSDPQLNTVEVCPPSSTYGGSQHRLSRKLREFVRDRQEQLTFVNVVTEIARQDFDIIHNNTLLSLPIKHANHLKIPMVSILHVPPVKEIKKVMSHSSRYPLHKIISVSHSNANLWEKALGYRPDVIHNGTDITMWKHKIKRPDNQFAVWVGRITPEKGLEYAIEAAQKANMDLKIIGPVSDERYFKTKIQPMFDERITYYGHLSHEIINHITMTSSVVVVSSVWDEPFGLVAIEALATGTPIAAFRMGALPEIVSAATGEIAWAKNTDDLAKAMRLCLAKDPAKCRAVAEQQFSLDSMIDNYEAEYEALLLRKTVERKAPQWQFETA